MRLRGLIPSLVLGIAWASAPSWADCPIPPSLNQCKACHALEPGKPSRATGPNLVGVPDQAAMHSPDFKGYSEALKAAQAKGLIWSDENLLAYLADPKAFLAGFNGEPLKNSMMFQLKDEAKRKAAIDGLKAIAACQ
jgi:cytochrome c